MKIEFICIGKTKTQFIADGIEFYHKRVIKYIPFSYIEIPLPSKSFKGSLEDIRRQENDLFNNYLKGTEYLILLDEKGHQFSSEKFAGYIQHLLNSIPRKIVFLEGGAFGFSEDIKKLASTTISLSSMTFPHQLFRIIFLEQLYRTFTILKNEPYHH